MMMGMNSVLCPKSEAELREELSLMEVDELRALSQMHILFRDDAFDDPESAASVLAFRARQQMAREMLAESHSDMPSTRPGGRA